MDAPKCRFCGKTEWRHKCGGLDENNVQRINRAKPKELVARRRLREGGAGGLAVPTVPVDLERKEPSRKQRWAKESYNAYQREYMRVWRAVRGGRACLLKGGV